MGRVREVLADRTIVCPSCEGDGHGIPTYPSDEFNAISLPCQRCNGSGICREIVLMRDDGSYESRYKSL